MKWFWIYCYCVRNGINLKLYVYYLLSDVKNTLINCVPTVLKDPLGQDNIRRQGTGDPNIPTSSANCEYKNKNKKSIVVSFFVTLCLEFEHAYFTM